jgi:hypothetical protein
MYVQMKYSRKKRRGKGYCIVSDERRTNFEDPKNL